MTSDVTRKDAVESESSRRGCLFRMVAVLVPILLGFGVSVFVLFQRGLVFLEDGGLRFKKPALYLEEPGHELTGHRYLYDENLGWRNIPDWKATTYGKPLTINSQGLRDAEHAYEKSGDTKRILVLGDSYAWGYGVADGETFSDKLEQTLAGRDEHWEVINTGVSGWGTDQQLLFLREEGLKYRPDVVVVAFFIGNDIDNNNAAEQYQLNKPVLLGEKLTPGNVPIPRPGQSIDPTVHLMLQQSEPVQHTVNILSGIADACSEQGCEMILMKFGNFLAPELPYAKDLEIRFETALDQAALKLRYLDLDERFQDRGFDAGKLTNGNNDGHWNAFGHEVVAEELDAFLSPAQGGN